MSAQGKVYLVGAGPGDPDLITVKGRDLIEQCDALVYDYLASPLMLEWTKPNCTHHYVGKWEGFHSVPQEEIQALLVRLAKEGKCVVRLKGGDPFVYGRGGEEVRHLRQANIDLEVVPGITAAIGAAAQMGVPLTDRNYSSGVVFLTGHEDPNKGGNLIPWEHYAKLDVTLCVYMAVKRLPDIVKALIDGGASPDCQVRAVQWATTNYTRACEGTLENIVEHVEAEGIRAPAIVIIGDVNRIGRE